MIDKIEKWHHEKKIWYNVVTFLSCIVVFITTYILILPAITLITSDGDIALSIASEWNDNSKNIYNLSFTFDAVKDYSYVFQYSEDDGQNWIDTSIDTGGFLNDKVTKPFSKDEKSIVNLSS